MQDNASDAEGFGHPVDREYYRRTWNGLVDRWEKHGLAELEALERQLEQAKERFLNGGSVAPSALRNAMVTKALEDGTFGELSEAEKPADVEEIRAAADEGVHVTERYVFARQLDRIDARLELTRVMIWFNIQGAKPPDAENVPAGIREEINRGLSARARTIQIGQALIEYHGKHEHLPYADDDGCEGRPFCGDKERFKEWAGEVIGRGPSTAYNAMRETGCYPVDKLDDSHEVEEAVEEVIRYALRYGGDLNATR